MKDGLTQRPHLACPPVRLRKQKTTTPVGFPRRPRAQNACDVHRVRAPGEAARDGKAQNGQTFNQLIADQNSTARNLTGRTNNQWANFSVGSFGARGPAGSTRADLGQKP